MQDALDDLLIYDKLSHQAHCLGPLAAHVWRTADGETTVDAIAATAPGVTSAAMVWDAIDSLRAQRLMDAVPPAPSSVSRRDVLTTAALITTVLVPLPAWAQSGPPLLGSGPQGTQGPQGDPSTPTPPTPPGPPGPQGPQVPCGPQGPQGSQC